MNNIMFIKKKHADKSEQKLKIKNSYKTSKRSFSWVKFIQKTLSASLEEVNDLEES